MFLYLSKLLSSGFLQFKGNFVRDQNNSKCCDWAPLEKKNYLTAFTLQNILNSLRQVTKDRTSIFIAHRLSTVVDADEILVLEEGRVRERGSHYSLITDSNSLYAHLWHKQHEAHKAEIDRTHVNDGTSAAGM